MNDDSMNPIPGNGQPTPDMREINRRATLWNSQREDLAAQISPITDYKHLAFNVLTNIGARDLNERFMFDKECSVAERILEWLDTNPQYSYYRDYIKQVPYLDFMELEATNTVHFNLWMNTNASLWLSTRDASSHRDLLWTLAIMRLSCFLNTGEWQPPNLNTPARA